MPDKPDGGPDGGAVDGGSGKADDGGAHGDAGYGSCADAGCSSGSWCGGSQCVRQDEDGTECAAGISCLSGNCVGGLCCDDECNGGCAQCDAPGALGKCNARPRGDPGVSPSCAPYRCDGMGRACPTTCSDGGTCVSTSTCAAGTCTGRKGNGQPCTSPDQCEFDNCIDGVCCNSSCDGGCVACNLPSSLGVCTVLGAQNGGSPSCTPYVCSGASSGCPTSCTGDNQCVAGDYCDGTACVPKKSNGQSCSAASQCSTGNCVNGTCCNSACGPCGSCSTGTCTALTSGAGGSPSCTPYVCDGALASCPTSCSGDSQCVSGDYCNTSCVSKKSNGQSCSAATQCSTGNCVDGTCCNSACGPCGSCSTGNCSALGSGSAGSPSCAPYVCGGAVTCPASCTGDAQCVTGDYCNGTTCVAKKSNGQSCSAASQCSTGNCVGGVCCNSACGACGNCSTGSCVARGVGAAGSPSCSPYVCGSGVTCATTCTLDSHCASGFFCDGSSCAPKKTPGQACSAATQCSTGYCANGVCCTAACGACGSCATGACSVSGAGAPGSPGCSPFVCDGSNVSCPSSCSGDAQCVAGRYCSGAACLAKLDDGKSCSAANQCLSGACTRFYRDADGDGFGKASESGLFCGLSAPTGYSAGSGDCCDSDSRAHPSQTSYFASATSCGGFDFDCSGVETLQYPAAFKGCLFTYVCGQDTPGPQYGYSHGFPCSQVEGAGFEPGWAVSAATYAFYGEGHATVPGCGGVGLYVSRCVDDLYLSAQWTACGSQHYCNFHAHPGHGYYDGPATIQQGCR